MIFFFLLSLLIYLQINIIHYFQESMKQLKCISYMNITSLIDYNVQNWWESNEEIIFTKITKAFRLSSMQFRRDDKTIRYIQSKSK